MLRCEDLRSVLVVAPHADDDVLGCGGLMARLADAPTKVHILFAAVDGFHHYGLPDTTTYAQRVAEIESVCELYRCTYEIAYGDKDLIEKLDTLPKRDLVDLFESALNTHRPDLLLLPTGADYDQDHVAVFETAFAAARPIAPQFGKWLVPHVLTYEMAKINWAAEPLPRWTSYCALTEEQLEAKLEGVRRYATQLRPSPHIRSLEAVRALACLRGKEIGEEYAEAFGVLRTVM